MYYFKASSRTWPSKVSYTIVMGIIEITAPYNYVDKGPFVDTENDLIHFGEYLNSHEDKNYTKAESKR